MQETLIVSSAPTSVRAQNTKIMKPLKLISFSMVVACTLLSSCILLEPSPLFSSSEHQYDDYDEIVDVDDNDEIDEILESKITIEFFYQDDSNYPEDQYYYEEAGCRHCSCLMYQRSLQHVTNCRCYNPVCVCGHSRASHLIAQKKPPLPVHPPRFEVFVPYNDIIATYKEAVDVAPITGAPDALQKTDVFINPLYIPAEGGSYEFEYANETFYISSVYDSSMRLVDAPLSTLLFKSVKSLSYNGSYYRISCNRGTHTWRIDVDPMPISDKPETRSIYVLMWTSSHNYNFVFQFDQSNFE